MPLKRTSSRRRAGSIYQLRVTLRGIDPPVWRRLLVPSATTLAQLHAIIQDAMGWQNYHLYRFTVGEGHFEAADPEAEGSDAAGTSLEGLLLKVGDVFEYLYDFGDDWHHEVVFEERVRPEPEVTYPLCADGARACPLENCGGPRGYVELLRALRTPQAPEYAETLRWVGNHFHPECFDLRATNRVLMLAYGSDV